MKPYRLALETGEGAGGRITLVGPWMSDKALAERLAKEELERIKENHKDVAVHVLSLERTFR